MDQTRVRCGGERLHEPRGCIAIESFERQAPAFGLGLRVRALGSLGFLGRASARGQGSQATGTLGPSQFKISFGKRILSLPKKAFKPFISGKGGFEDFLPTEFAELCQREALCGLVPSYLGQPSQSALLSFPT